MNFFTKIFLFFFLFGVLFFSCKKDKTVEAPINYGYNYFPDEVGNYVIYQVDSIAQDDISNKHDTTRYLLKELIASVFTDLSGRPTLRIERYFKFYNKNIPYDQMPWSAPRVWFANKTSSGLQRVEENIRYLKLIFPVKKGRKWNGNVYNILGEKDYEIDSADVAMQVNNLLFDSVAVVKQYQEINLVQYQVEKEKFARNIGLIYKQRDSLSINPRNGNDFPPYDDTVGYFFTQKIISYGK